MTIENNPLLPHPPTDAQSVLVSVIIPAFNAAAFIRAALDSVFAQSFTGYEVIVVNDGSPDTIELERALQPFQNRIRYISQENKGPAGARNTAVLQMRGKYAAFLDGDDTWLPAHLSNQIAMLTADPALDLVYADSILTENGRPVGHAFGREPQSPPVTFESILTEDCTISTSSAVAARESLIAAGMFDEKFTCCEDFDLWLRMAFHGAKINFHPAVHLYHRLSPDSASGNRLTMKRARIEVYEKMAATLPVSESQRSLIRRLIARTQAECQTDLLKEFLHARQYAKALETAKLAGSVKNNWKMKLTILGLRTAPAIVRYYHHVHERLLAVRNRARRANSLSKLKNGPTHLAIE